MPALALLLTLVLTPIVEILVIVQAVDTIGGWWTLAALVATSVLGGWISRREGVRALGALQEGVRRGVVPDRELTDAALVLLGGLLLLAPGFVTDAAGLLLVLPFTRPPVRRLLRRAMRRFDRTGARRAAFPPGAGGLGGLGEVSFDPYRADGPEDAREHPRGRVVRGEVIGDAPDDERSGLG